MRKLSTWVLALLIGAVLYLPPQVFGLNGSGGGGAAAPPGGGCPAGQVGVGGTCTATPEVGTDGTQSTGAYRIPTSVANAYTFLDAASGDTSGASVSCSAMRIRQGGASSPLFCLDTSANIGIGGSFTQGAGMMTLSPGGPASDNGLRIGGTSSTWDAFTIDNSSPNSHVLIANGASMGPIFMGQPFTPKTFTVATLPASCVKNQVFGVSDLTAATVGTCTGGGSVGGIAVCSATNTYTCGL